MIDKFTVNINKTRLNSLSMFFSINGRCTDTCKDTYFLRYIGFDNKNNYLEQINAADTLAQNNNYGYFRVKNSLCLPAQTDTELYILRFEKFLLYPDQLDFGFKFLNNSLNTLLKDNFSMALELFKKTKNGVTDSIVKNFGIKLLFWIDKYFPILFSNESLPLRSPKFIYSGNIKEQEYIFLYLLACTGCDVLYLNPTTDASVNQNLLKLSQILICSNKQAVEIPNIKQPNPNSVSKSRPAESNKSKNSMDLHIMQSGENTSNKIRIPPKLNVSKPTRQRFILEYEELAKIASSVVMISVYNNKKECFKTGSGVMIGSEGYILTNFHVVSGGSYYGINVENDENSYFTDELLKYNQDIDLALIRIDKRLIPVNIYTGEAEIARGQKVVAIGSPLGLFNSVSDGIVSGFRNINNIPMIQYTAPTSHGSSGGAVLNMYGELIGISTAGIDEGQNINLAVSYKNIIPFIKGFIKQR